MSNSVRYKKGFCPTLQNPIISADGLLVRIQTFMSSLDKSKLLLLCKLAEEYGSGVMELTNKGSIQVRGIKKNNYSEFVKEILENKIILNENDHKFNISVNPFWKHNDLNKKIYKSLMKIKFPDLHRKFSIVLDIGSKRYLKNISSDIRFENTRQDKLLMRLGESLKGRVIELNEIDVIIQKTLELVSNFNKKKGIRMSEILKKKKLEDEWFKEKPVNNCLKLFPKNTKYGQILGIKLGRFMANDLEELIKKYRIPRIRFLPNRMILLEKVQSIKTDKFIFNKRNPFLKISACSGKNFCMHSSINTVELAHKIKNNFKKRIHITGCEKNCGVGKETKILLTGNKGFVDVIDYKSKKTILKKKEINDFSKKNII